MTATRLSHRLRQACTGTRRPHEAGAATIGVLLAAGGAFALLWPSPSSHSWPTAQVRQGAFADVLVETGTVGAARLMLYGSKIAGGPAKILAIVPEGRMVAAGEELIRFDSAPFEQELAREEAAAGQARAERQRAAELLRLEQLAARAETDEAEQAIGYAETDLLDETEGRGRVELAEAEATAADATREVERARASVADLQALLAQGFVTRLELERAEQALQRAEEQQRLAELRRDTLVTYGRPAAVDRARADVRVARERVARSRESAASRLAERRAALALAESRVAEVEARLVIVRDRLAHTVVRAEAPGLVVYRDLFFGSDRRKPQVGDEVWPNQPVIAIPDVSSLIVETRIREVDLHKLAAVETVRVTVDALPDLRLAGEIAVVGALAQDEAARAGTRTFPVSVALLDYDSRLRTGMTARVELAGTAMDVAVLVPSQAVFERESQTLCHVLVHGRPEVRVVQVIADNGLDAAIAEGVTPGEVVLLVDPAREPIR